MCQSKSPNLKGHNRLVKGIIFDLDGTLIKSVVDFPKMKLQMIKYIRSLDLDIDKVNYTPKQTTNQIILDFHDKMLKAGLDEDQRIIILERISDILTEVEFENISKVELLPGVTEFFTTHENDGLKMGILTRASKKYTQRTLELTELSKYFSVIVTRDDFTLLKAKPHQKALKYTLEQLALEPEETLFVGDHNIDYTCAQNGEVRFVGVLSGAYNRQMLYDLNCELLVEDFFELTQLIKEINRVD